MHRCRSTRLVRTSCLRSCLIQWAALGLLMRMRRHPPRHRLQLGVALLAVEVEGPGHLHSFRHPNPKSCAELIWWWGKGSSDRQSAAGRGSSSLARYDLAIEDGSGWGEEAWGGAGAAHGYDDQAWLHRQCDCRWLGARATAIRQPPQVRRRMQR